MPGQAAWVAVPTHQSRHKSQVSDSRGSTVIVQIAAQKGDHSSVYPGIQGKGKTGGRIQGGFRGAVYARAVPFP